MIVLTQEEKIRFRQWVIENINESVVPCDEGNGNALKYNMIHLILDGENFSKYNHLESQDKEIEGYVV